MYYLLNFSDRLWTHEFGHLCNACIYFHSAIVWVTISKQHPVIKASVPSFMLFILLVSVNTNQAKLSGKTQHNTDHVFTITDILILSGSYIWKRRPNHEQLIVGSMLASR